MATARLPDPEPKQVYDSRRDMLLGNRALLYSIFNPKNIAIVGDVERTGTLANKSLLAISASSFAGSVFAIHTRPGSVHGVQSYPNIFAIPTKVDLAVVAVPPEDVPEIVDQCAKALVKGVVVISGGFEQRDRGRTALEQKIIEKLCASRMRLIGPGCAAVINPAIGLNASLGMQMPLGGTVALLSESGAVSSSILEWSLKQIVGFSACVSVGTMANVGWGDLIDYFGSDPNTHSIVVYMESLDNARSFLSAAREVSLKKPIIVIKAGRSETAMGISGVEDGNVSAADDVLEAAFRRVGVLRVTELTDLFSMADVLSKQPRPAGPRLMVISNASEGVRLAADSVIASGGQLAQLSSTTRAEIDSLASHEGNVGFGAFVNGSPEDYTKAIEIAVQDGNCDGLLVVTLPQIMSDPRKATDLLLAVRKPAVKPILACYMGGETAEAQELLTRACIPTFSSTDAAARAFNYMWQYSYNLRGIYETPLLHSDVTAVGLRQLAEAVLHAARDSGRTLLTDVECRQLLAAYQIPTLPVRTARREEEAVRIAGEIGFPVRLKPLGEPADQLEGLPLHLADADAVRGAWNFVASRLADKIEPDSSFTVALQSAVQLDGYELRIAGKIDPQFGPVLLFGAGGKLEYMLQDCAVGLVPLNATLARRVMEQTRIYSALLRDARKSFDLPGLEAVLVRLGQLLVEQPWIKEIEINPLLISPQHLLVLDARVVVHGPGVKEDQLTKPAIRPYPAHHVSSWTMKDGQKVTVRPIRPEDEPLMIRFYEQLSDKSVYLRYFSAIGLRQRTDHDWLTRICFIDYDREMALVVERRDPKTYERKIIGLANMTKVYGRKMAEIAVITSDEYQGKGLASQMLRCLIQVAREEKLQHVLATTMTENLAMCAVMKRLGFHVSVNIEDHEVEGVLEL